MSLLEATINDTQVNIYSVKDVLESEYDFYYNLFDFGEDASDIDVRLRVFNGHWEVLTGDSQYDTDHRGTWAYGSFTPGMDSDALELLAIDLVEQLENQV